MFGVLTDASGNVLRNYVYDAFSGAPYKRQYVGESFPSQSNHTGSCQSALSEPGITTGSGGRGLVVPSRGFQVMGNKPAPAKKQAYKVDWYKDCMDTCKSDYNDDKQIDLRELAFLSGMCLGSSGTDLFACGAAC